MGKDNPKAESYDDVLIYDVESMDTVESTILLAISLLSFSFDEIETLESIFGVEQVFEELVKKCDTYSFEVADQKEMGRTVSKDTLAFWKKNPEAYKMTMGFPRKTIADLPEIFHSHMEKNKYREKKTKIYIRGPHFDHPIVMNAIRDVHGQEVFVYHHFMVRDVRTSIDDAFGTTSGYVDEWKVIADAVGVVKHNPEHDIALDAIQLYLAHQERNNTNEVCD